jgi:hypothetical protein
MILTVHSDASYLSESKARSRAGGFFYMGSKQRDAALNGAILATTSIMKSVLSSAAEAEIGALFENCKKATILRTTLEEMGWPQPATPMQTDNSTACGIANDTIKQQRSRAIDMRFYWVRDRTKQGHFDIFWKPGSTNLADYFTKHHPAKHHQLMRPKYLYVKANKESECEAAIANALLVLQGCIETPTNAGQTRTLTESPASQNQHAQADASFVTNGEEKANSQMANGRLRRHAIL